MISLFGCQTCDVRETRVMDWKTLYEREREERLALQEKIFLILRVSSGPQAQAQPSNLQPVSTLPKPWRQRQVEKEAEHRKKAAIDRLSKMEAAGEIPPGSKVEEMPHADDGRTG